MHGVACFPADGAGKSMDGYEICIPEDAEVKTFPLWCLPKRLLRGVDLLHSDLEGSGGLAGSPECTWISPAILRETCCPPGNHTGDADKQTLSSLLSRKVQTLHRPFQMPFVCSNPTAHKVLRRTMLRERVSTQTAHDSLPQVYRDAVIICEGRIYLSIKKLKQMRNRGETPGPKPVAQSLLSDYPLLETSASASDSHNLRRSPRGFENLVDTVLQNRKRLLKKRCLASQLKVILPKMSPEELKGRSATADPRSTREELKGRCTTADPRSTREELKGRYATADPRSTREMGVTDQESMKKYDMCEDEAVTLTTNEDEFMTSEMDTSSSMAAHSVLLDSGGIRRVDGVYKEANGKYPGGEQPVEEGCPEAWQQEVDQEVVTPASSGEPDMEDGGLEEAESADQNAMGGNSQVDGGQVNRSAYVPERYIMGLAFASSPVRQEFDFEQLAKEEMISRMRVKLRESEAALNNLQSSK